MGIADVRTDYAAPEVLQGKAYGGKEQDVWALGILLYTIVYKENPFYNIGTFLFDSAHRSVAFFNRPLRDLVLQITLLFFGRQTASTGADMSQTRSSTTRCASRTCHSARAALT